MAGKVAQLPLEGNSMTKAIDFGALPRVSNSQVIERVFAAWINPDSVAAGTKAIIAPFADSGGVMMYISTAALLLYYNRHNVSPGAWNSTTTSLTTGAWQHVMIYYNHTSVNNNPLMWINGVAQSVTEIFAPAGTLQSELGTHVVIGNAKTATQDYTYTFQGQIYDPRIYANRGMTDAEAVTLYNGGTPDPSLVTDGLVFQAACVRTDHAADYIDLDIEGMYLFDNIYKAVGRVVGDRTGGVIARAAP
jgi:hypothetical protein